jgi:hypothetical protein
VPGNFSKPEEVARPRTHGVVVWEAMYPVIRQLYVTEHRKLSEVMKILERRYGFKAT